MTTQVNEANGGEEASRECPECHSKRNWKAGFRETNFGSVQRLKKTDLPSEIFFRCRYIHQNYF